MSKYVTQLKQIAEHCNFGDTAHLKEILRDRLVCCSANDKWQQRLLSEEGDLTYDKTLKLLIALEAAEKEVKDLASKQVLDRLQPVPVVPSYHTIRRKATPSSESNPILLLLLWWCLRPGYIIAVFSLQSVIFATNEDIQCLCVDRNQSDQVLSPQTPLLSLAPVSCQSIQCILSR